MKIKPTRFQFALGSKAETKQNYLSLGETRSGLRQDLRVVEASGHGSDGARC